MNDHESDDYASEVILVVMRVTQRVAVGGGTGVDRAFVPICPQC